MIIDCDFLSSSIYPLTVTLDRYSGVYSGGEFIAWPLEVGDVPKAPFDSDVECMAFWYSDHVMCGVGNTPEAAIADLYIKLKQEANA